MDKVYPFAVYRTSFHGGGKVSSHRTQAAAEAAAKRLRGDCLCGCARVVTAEQAEALPAAVDCRNPYAAAR